MKRPFIIDCDTGTDDAIALVAALHLPSLDLKAVTSVNGNVNETYTSSNNLNLLSYLNCEDIEVCRGAKRPLLNKNIYADITHGKKGLGNIILPTSSNKFSSLIACEKIYEVAKNLKGELEILALGPLTNIALTIINHPDVVPLIKHLYFMGGAIYGGNSTTSAEFNIWVDPEAAKIVFNSGLNLTMVGLDVTLKAKMEEEDTILLREKNTKDSILVANLLDYMFLRHSGGGEGALMHDALALAAAFNRDCLTYKNCYGDVEINGQYTRGHTYFDMRNRYGYKPNIEVATDINVFNFRKWLVNVICE